MIIETLHQISNIATPWLAAPPPSGRPVPGDVELPGQLGTKLSTLMGWGLRLGYVACFFGLVFCAGKMALAHRRGEEINFVGLGGAMAACLLLGSAGAIADVLIF